MGSGASIDLPDCLTEYQCREIAGENFDDNLFQSISTSGTISKDRFLKLIHLRKDCFLTHDWGNELGMDNHARVAIINKALQTRGLSTWFDEEQMQGNIKKQMVSGIDNAQCVVVFITKRYTEKVAGDNAEDNCQLEFNYAALRKTATHMISVVMEERMRNTRTWGGEVAMVLGGRLYVDLCGDLNDDTYLNEKADELYKTIMTVIGSSVNNFKSNLLDNTKINNTIEPTFTHSTNELSVMKLDIPNKVLSIKKPLKDLSVADVCSLLDSINFSIYIETFKTNSIDGICLNECSSPEDLKEMGISIAVKAKLFYNQFLEFKTFGVPEEYLVHKKEVIVETKKEKNMIKVKTKKDKSVIDDKPVLDLVITPDNLKNNSSKPCINIHDYNQVITNENTLRTNSKKPKCTKHHDMPYILSNSSENHSNKNWICGLCDKKMKDFPDTIWSSGRYHCKQDNDNICIICYDKAKMHMIANCKQGHEMVYTLNNSLNKSTNLNVDVEILTTDISGIELTTKDKIISSNDWNCMICSGSKRYSSLGINGRFYCLPCNLNICSNCCSKSINPTLLESQILINCDEVFTRMHNHSLHEINMKEKWYCMGRKFSWGCISKFNTYISKDEKDIKRWRCIDNCDFDLCEKCLLAHMIQ